MMTSFKWKRKIGANVCKLSAHKFSLESEEDTNVINGNWVDDVRTVSPNKRHKVTALEDSLTKSKRLCEEGSILAQEERYWEALKKWDEALALDPTNEKLYELKSQVYLELHELIPAVTAAEKVVELKPTWWIGYQTLGRAQVSLGEVQMAIKNFSKSCHLNPEAKELWVEDLGWACSLLSKLNGDDEQQCTDKRGMDTAKIDALVRWSQSIASRLATSSNATTTTCRTPVKNPTTFVRV